MRIATWNINSLKARQDRVESWLRENEPDVLVLQETKCADAVFPHGAFVTMGYESAHHGNGRWNGVAILSRVGLEDARAGFYDESPGDVDETRVLSATCGGVRVYSVYVPNGRALDTEFYLAKLGWLRHLRADLEATCEPRADVAICGDFNIAPEDRDVWDASQFQGQTHVSAPEREALQELLAWGLHDTFRHLHPDEVGPFSWWDYRAGAFHKGQGMRIDLELCSSSLFKRAREAFIDREARKKGPGATTTPSDHAPVVVDFDDS